MPRPIPITPPISNPFGWQVRKGPLPRLALAAGLTFFLAAAPLRAEPSPMASGLAEFGFGAASRFAAAGGLVAVAMADIGATGPQLGLPSRLWCADAVNRWRRKAGLSVVASRLARDQARQGRRLAAPVAGALMISSRKRGGHVDLIAAVHGDGSVMVIRPNWSRRVTLARIWPRGFFILPS